MTSRLFLAVPLSAAAAAANAATTAGAGGSFDGATLSGMLLLAGLATTLLRVGLKEWRRETGRHEPVRLKVRARRYNQP
jgi:hypothetical protein